MKPDVKYLKAALQQRKTELQRLINQMKYDRLNSSSVYKNLEQELETVKDKLQQAVENPGEAN